MDEQTLDRLIRFLMVVDRCHHKIYVGERKGQEGLGYIPGTDFAISKRKHNSRLALDALLRILSSDKLSGMAKQGAKSTKQKTTRVPIEPLEYTREGRGYLKNEIGRLARDDITKLLLELDGFRKHREVITNIRGSGNVAYLKKLFQEHPEPDKILQMLSRIPDEFIDLVKRVGFGTYSGIVEMEDVENKIYEPQIAIVGLEQCDRACDHCGSLATPRRERMAYETFEDGMNKIGPASKLTFSYGEPLIWNYESGGQELTVANLIKFASQFGVKIFEIVTSGINFHSAKEAEAASKLAELPEEIRRNMILALTVSDFPHFKGGIPPREVQKNTVAFACAADLPLDIISFMAHQKVFRELIVASAIETFPGIQSSDMIQTSSQMIKVRKVGGMGRAAPKMEPYADFIHYTRVARWECISKRGLRYRGVENPDMMSSKIAEMLRNNDGTFNQEGKLAIMANGDLVPGCCHFISAYTRIANIKEEKEEIRRKTNDFFRKLDRLRLKGRLDCISCTAVAPEIRNPRLLKRGHGEKVFTKVMQRRKELAKI